MNSDNGFSVLGYISQANQPVRVVDENGNVRIVEEGDPVYINETVENGLVSKVVIELINGQLINLAASQSILMNIDLLGTTASGTTEEQEQDSQESSSISAIPDVSPIEQLAPTSTDNDEQDSTEPEEVTDSYVQQAIVEREIIEDSTELEDVTGFQGTGDIEAQFIETDQQVVNTIDLNDAPVLGNQIFRAGQLHQSDDLRETAL